MLFGKRYSPAVSLMPHITAYLVKSFYCPFDDIERVNTAFAVRGEFIHAFRDPLCPVSGNYPDGGKLFRCDLLIKLCQDIFAMSLCRPYNGIGVVVNNDRDVLMPVL